MKPLVGRCDYDLHTYSHRQFWRLVRDLTSCGWTVTIRANEERRPPWKLPEAEDGYECWVKNPGFDVDVSHCRRGKTAWAALKAAVEEIVGPAESGTANRCIDMTSPRRAEMSLRENSTQGGDQ